MNKLLAFFIVTLLTASTLPLPASADASQDIPTNASATGVHNSLVAALAHVNLVTTLQSTGPFTVFAPTDQAFADAGIDLNDFDTPEENATLANILKHHVVAGEVESADLSDGMLATTVNNDRVKFSVSAGQDLCYNTFTHAVSNVSSAVCGAYSHVNVSAPSSSGQQCYNNASHAFNNDAESTCTSYAYYENYSWGGTSFTGCYNMDTHTTNNDNREVCESYAWHNTTTLVDEYCYNSQTMTENYDSSVEECTSYTFVEKYGAGVSVDGASVTTADVQASNGIIHIIDKVLMPPGDIPTIAQSTGIHNSLVAAVTQADLLTTFQGAGPFTLFAPTDQAFADAGINLADFNSPEGKVALANILKHHVIDGDATASFIANCGNATMLNGQDVGFSITANGAMINDANIVLTDVVASNGIIHVIDKVLTPSDEAGDIPRTAGCTGAHN